MIYGSSTDEKPQLIYLAKECQKLYSRRSFGLLDPGSLCTRQHSLGTSAPILPKSDNALHKYFVRNTAVSEQICQTKE
jgi:hypothetical protein